MMDSQISKCREPLPENIKEEEFQKWEPEDGETEETVPTTQINGNQYWSVDDMFKANKKLCSESDFASDLSQYQTTTVNATAEDRERANDIARQIENDSMSRHNARLENDDEERNLDAKTHFEEAAAQPSANNVTSWRSQPNRSANNPSGGSGGGRMGFRGDRDRNNERVDSSGYRDRGSRGYKPLHHQQQRSAGASTTNVVTTTSISNALTSPTTSATSAKNGEAAVAPPPSQPAALPATIAVSATTPGAQSVSAPNITLVKTVTPPPPLLPHPTQQLPPPSLQQRPLASNVPTAPPASSSLKFKFNPDAPSFVPAAAKKEMRTALSPSVTPITSVTNHGVAINNNGGGAGGGMAPLYMIGGTTGMAPSMHGMPPQGIPMQFVQMQSYPPPANFMYNVVPSGVGQQMVSSGMIVQNHQPTVFQSQQQQPAPMIQPPGSQAYPPPTNFVYKGMTPGGVPPHVIAASGPSGGVIVPNHQQAAAFQQQQQQQLMQQANPQGYPPRGLVYTGMLPGQSPVISSSGGHAPNMIQIQGMQPGVYQQQPPPMIHQQVNQPARKSGPYGGYSEDGR